MDVPGAISIGIMTVAWGYTLANIATGFRIHKALTWKIKRMGRGRRE